MSIQPAGDPRSSESLGSKLKTGGVAPDADKLRVLLVHPVGSGRVGQIRYPGQQLIALPADHRLLRLGLRQLLLEPPQLGLSRSGPGGLPFDKRRLHSPECFRALGVPPPARVGRQQRIEVSAGAAPRQRSPVPVGLPPGSLEVNHPGESSGAARDAGGCTAGS